MKIIHFASIDSTNKYAKENLSAEKAAENGYIDDVVSEEELRDTLADAWDLLSNKQAAFCG